MIKSFENVRQSGEINTNFTNKLRPLLRFFYSCNEWILFKYCKYAFHNFNWCRSMTVLSVWFQHYSEKRCWKTFEFDCNETRCQPNRKRIGCRAPWIHIVIPKNSRSTIIWMNLVELKVIKTLTCPKRRPKSKIPQGKKDFVSTAARHLRKWTFWTALSELIKSYWILSRNFRILLYEPVCADIEIRKSVDLVVCDFVCSVFRTVITEQRDSERKNFWIDYFVQKQWRGDTSNEMTRIEK